MKKFILAGLFSVNLSVCHAASGILIAASAADNVTVAGNAEILTQSTFTMMMYTTPISQSANQRWWVKPTGSGTRAQSAGGVNQQGRVNITIARTVGASATSFASVINNNPTLVVTSFNFVDGPKIMIGLTTSTINEQGYQAGPTLGSGVLTADTGDLELFNRTASRSINSIFHRVVFVCGRIVTLSEIQANQWVETPIPGTKVLFNLGWNSLGTQQDYSGTGNSGTVGGAPTISNVGYPLNRFGVGGIQ